MPRSDRTLLEQGSAADSCAHGVLMRQTTHLVKTVAGAPAVGALVEALLENRRVVATGAVGSSTSFVAAAVAQLTDRPTLLITAHLDDADEIQDELDAWGVEVLHLPALETLPGETDASLELFAQRLGAVRQVVAGAAGGGGRGGGGRSSLIVCPIQALMQAVPSPTSLRAISIRIAPNDVRDPADLARWLDAAGYRRVDAIDEPGDFAIRGGIVDIFPAGAQSGAAAPVRLDFFGDEIERITEIDLDTMGSDRALNHVELVTANADAALGDQDTVNFLELLPDNTIAILAETQEITEQARGYYERVTDARGIYGPPAVFKIMQERFGAIAEINQYSSGAASADIRIELPVCTLPSFATDASDAVAELGEMAAEPGVLLVACENDGEHTRLRELITEFASKSTGRIESVVQYVHRGFIWGEHDAQLTVVPYHELLHRYHMRRRGVRLRSARAMDTFLDFAPGDFVVHAEHGIAHFKGLTLMKPKRDGARGAGSAEQEEYLTLEFAGRSRLHVPVTQIDLIQKYIGGFSGTPPLSTLGGVKWKNQKQKVFESVKGLASEMLRVRAARSSMPGIRYPADTAWQKEFEAEFPYQETEDQLAAMGEIKKDMLGDRPMDRLLCGDVGFGKTELAIRAAFKAAEYGKQVAVLVPTTVLAEQHERTFKARFADYPFRIASLSRFKTVKEANQTLKQLRAGAVDIIIGTHRLLSNDVAFADLGLVIIDEEQRFGVEHKERLLQLRMTVDVLTLSATPIPRTLHMAMLGLRDISSLATPPLDRRAIVTEVIPYNGHRIKQAITRELARDGQVFFVHNRVHNIRSMADEIQKLAPEARIVVGHGQMPPRELENVMLKFIRRQADILVATTIIESGIDIPTANTMFINDADRFGLADLHQLRGRVGRYKHRAYCYLLLSPERNITQVARRRLKAVEQYSMLGAGFKIAMRDLEIRGAGNLLGAEQSGHIAAVGYDMFCRLLDQAVKELSNESTAEPSRTTIDIGIRGVIPRPYIPSDMRRMEAYRRISTAGSTEELAKVAQDITQAYGQLPRPVERLLELAEIRIGAAALEVKAIVVRSPDVVFRTENTAPIVSALNGIQGTVRALAPKSNESLSEVYFRPPAEYLEPDTLAAVLRRRLAVEPESVLPN